MLEGLGPFGQWLGPIGGIILADLVLSGDNALIIGAAAAGLPPKQRWWAIMLGGGGAIVLRILFAFLVTWLLMFPLLQAIGGAILIYIAIKLLVERDHNPHPQTGEESARKESATAKKSFVGALSTILIADVTMSLDNVLAVGALAHGDLVVLTIGLVLSIVILLLGSALISSIIQRLPWVLDLASIVLGWTAADMILKDAQLKGFFDPYPWTHIALPVVCIAFVAIVDIYLLLRARQKREKLQKAIATEDESQIGTQADIKV